jgi:hypothetical protein
MRVILRGSLCEAAANLVTRLTQMIVYPFRNLQASMAAISSALYKGTTSVVPQTQQNEAGLWPLRICGINQYDRCEALKTNATIGTLH